MNLLRGWHQLQYQNLSIEGRATLLYNCASQVFAERVMSKMTSRRGIKLLTALRAKSFLH